MEVGKCKGMYISQDVAEILWDTMEKKTWENLWSVVEHQAGDVYWIRDETYNVLLQEVRLLRYQSVPFPKNPYELAVILNKHAGRFVEAH